MKHIRLIRHGESAANAGAPSQDHASIPLTAKGREQALGVAGSFAQAPELIVTSPFSRAQATARATVAVFPGTPLETWPVQEFTYLAPAKCMNTTVADRRRWVEDYWAKAAPAHVDGAGAESFAEFIARAQSLLARLAEHPADDVAVFSHGQFINAVAWLLERRPAELDSDAMGDWRAYDIAHPVENGGGCQLFSIAGEPAWALGARSAFQLSRVR